MTRSSNDQVLRQSRLLSLFDFMIEKVSRLLLGLEISRNLYLTLMLLLNVTFKLHRNLTPYEEEHYTM